MKSELLKCSLGGFNVVLTHYCKGWVSAIAQCGLNLGISHHHKASLDPIILWKHQPVLMNHNNFMKQIGSQIFIRNHSNKFFWRPFLYVCGFFEFFYVWNLCFWIFIQKNFIVTQIFKCLTVQNHLLWQDQQNVVEKIWKW